MHVKIEHTHIKRRKNKKKITKKYIYKRKNTYTATNRSDLIAKQKPGQAETT